MNEQVAKNLLKLQKEQFIPGSTGGSIAEINLVIWTGLVLIFDFLTLDHFVVSSISVLQDVQSTVSYWSRDAVQYRLELVSGDLLGFCRIWGVVEGNENKRIVGTSWADHQKVRSYRWWDYLPFHVRNGMVAHTQNDAWSVLPVVLTRSLLSLDDIFVNTLSLFIIWWGQQVHRRTM